MADRRRNLHFSGERDTSLSDAAGGRQDRTERAIHSALNMMGYRENSEGMLRQKLTRKGYTREECDAAIAFLEKKGILREAEAIAHQVEYLANTMLYGKRRIVQMLLTKGYRREQIDPSYFEGIDFAAKCSRRIHRRSLAEEDGSLPQNAVASLVRAGFSYSDISEGHRLYRQQMAENADGDEA